MGLAESLSGNPTESDETDSISDTKVGKFLFISLSFGSFSIYLVPMLCKLVVLHGSFSILFPCCVSLPSFNPGTSLSLCCCCAGYIWLLTVTSAPSCGRGASSFVAIFEQRYRRVETQHSGGKGSPSGGRGSAAGAQLCVATRL